MFIPDDKGMEETIKGYGYYLKDRSTDATQYFGFPDDLKTEFSHMILPKNYSDKNKYDK
jgi:hypothetical protein